MKAMKKTLPLLMALAMLCGAGAVQAAPAAKDGTAVQAPVNPEAKATDVQQPRRGHAALTPEQKKVIAEKKAKADALDDEIFVKEAEMRAYEHAGNAKAAADAAREIVKKRAERRALLKGLPGHRGPHGPHGFPGHHGPHDRG